MAGNLSSRVLCPCNRCKKMVLRTRHIAAEHVETWGEWNDNIIFEQMQSFARNEPIDISQIRPSFPPRSHMYHAGSSLGRHTFMAEGGDNSTSNNEMHSIEDEDMVELIDALCDDVNEDISEESNADIQRDDQTADALQKLAHNPLFESSRSSILHVCLSILNLQSIYGWSDASVNALLHLLKTSILPEANELPKSRDKMKSILSKIGMDYECIHACPNDCILFCGVNTIMESCPRCQSPRYRRDVAGTTIPSKILRNFPIIPRITHMFKCPEIAKLMSWHATGRSTDDIMRIPADLAAWQHIEEKWPDFKKEPRHLRLGLAMDGVNPFGLRSTTWSTWPIVVVNYNLQIGRAHV